MLQNYSVAGNSTENTVRQIVSGHVYKCARSLLIFEPAGFPFSSNGKQYLDADLTIRLPLQAARPIWHPLSHP